MVAVEQWLDTRRRCRPLWRRRSDSYTNTYTADGRERFASLRTNGRRHLDHDHRYRIWLGRDRFARWNPGFERYSG